MSKFCWLGHSNQRPLLPRRRSIRSKPMRTLPGQVVTPAGHEHRLPEEPEKDEGREADQDRPLVAARRTQGFVLTPQNVLDVAFGLII